MNQSMLDSRYTLRSKSPEMIEQELWGLLLGYYLRFLHRAGYCRLAPAAIEIARLINHARRSEYQKLATQKWHQVQ